MDVTKIIDISQEVLGCRVYPGNRVPKAIAEKRMAEGESCNLSSFEMCAHNGTHMDAPFHFFTDGKTIEDIPLRKTVGWCVVLTYDGNMEREDAEQILARARSLGREASNKLLLKGDAIISETAALVFAQNGLDLIGVESQSVGPPAAPMQVHRILLQQEICLLEGIRLSEVEEGVYFLHAAPLLLAGFDGAPCRATLTRF